VISTDTFTMGFLTSTIDSVFISHALYILLVTRYGQPNGLMAAFENTWSVPSIKDVTPFPLIIFVDNT
jgi:hypothetical protein